MKRGLRTIGAIGDIRANQDRRQLRFKVALRIRKAMPTATKATTPTVNHKP
jgi:hypothetical protein